MTMKDEPVNEADQPEQVEDEMAQDQEDQEVQEEVVDDAPGEEEAAGEAPESDEVLEAAEQKDETEEEATESEEVLELSEIDVSEAQEAPEEIRRAIEALILVADTPVSPSLLAQLTEVSAATVAKVCQELAAEYESENRGFVLVNVAGGFRFQTHADLAPYIERFALEGQSSRLSAAALETLAIIAYKQPLSRAQVAAIRGVNADAVMRTLQQRGYIDEIAREEGQGLSVLFETTDTFLERIGLSAIDELPALGDFAPGSEVVEALEQSLSAEPIDEELVRSADIGAEADGPAEAETSSDEAAIADVDIDISPDAVAQDDVAQDAVAQDAAAEDDVAKDDAFDEEASVEAGSVDDRLDAVVIDLRDSARSEQD